MKRQFVGNLVQYANGEKRYYNEFRQYRQDLGIWLNQVQHYRSIGFKPQMKDAQRELVFLRRLYWRRSA